MRIVICRMRGGKKGIVMKKERDDQSVGVGPIYSQYMVHDMSKGHEKGSGPKTAR